MTGKRTTISLFLPAVASKEGIARPDKRIVNAETVNGFYPMLGHIIKDSTPDTFIAISHTFNGREVLTRMQWLT